MNAPVRVTCHCGAVELSVTLVPDAFETKRRCNCSFCARKGFVALTALTQDVRVVKGQEALRLYQFGSHTARHWFCSTCGIHTHHQRKSDPRECAVNAACVEGVDISQWKDVPWHDGLSK